MTIPQITAADIRALANEQSFNRGYRYFQDGAVFNLVQRGNWLSASVQGSDYAPYEIQVRFNDSGIAETTCTCPYDWGGACKHIVAVLLSLVDDNIDIEQRPSLSTLLAPLSAAQLRDLMLGLAETDPDLTRAIEREVGWRQEQADRPDQTVPVAVDLRAVRREIQKDFRLIGHGDPYEHGYHDEYAALEIDPESMMAPHLEKVKQLLDAGDLVTAASLITTILDEYADGVGALDEWVLEYNEDVLYEANVTIGAVLAEVLLSQTPDRAPQWRAQIKRWEQAIGGLAIVQMALEHGWTYPPLVAAMGGHMTEAGAWDREPPHHLPWLFEAGVAFRPCLAANGRIQSQVVKRT